MPSFHANTIGQGLILATPTADGQADEVMTTDGAGKLVLTTIKAGGLADGAVTGDKLAEPSVSEDKIYDLAVSSQKLAIGAVDTPHLASLAVTADKIAPDSVVNYHIADGQITASKMDLGGGFDWSGPHGHSSGVHFDTEPISTGNNPAVDLRARNHQTIDATSATGTVAVTITPPAGSSSGSIIVKQGETPRDINWAVTAGSISWLGFEPPWNDPGEADHTRIVSYRWDGMVLYLTATERD